MSQYAFDNGWRQARQCLALLAQSLDPATTRRLAALGLGAGWHCWEIGAGGGSIAPGLCVQVGPKGRVLATDLAPGFWRR